MSSGLDAAAYGEFLRLGGVTSAAQEPRYTPHPTDIGGDCLLTRASDVRFERVSWFSRDRIPYGGLTLLDGPGGVGKTTLMLGAIAAATRGKGYFDNEGLELGAAVALIIAEEDALGLLKAKLDVANGDLSRVYFLEGMKVDGEIVPFEMPFGVDALEEAIVQTSATVVFVDALFSHLTLKGDGKMSQQVRRALRPLVKMIERTNIAFFAIRHWAKAHGAASSRALGSAELANVARSVLSFGAHPHEDGKFCISPSKMNLARFPATLAYRIDEVATVDDDGNATAVTRAVLEGVVDDVTADDLAMRSPADPDERGVAEDWLRDYLAAGGTHASAQVYRDARSAGVGSPATLRRVASAIGVVKERSATLAARGESASTWRLPPSATAPPSAAVSSRCGFHVGSAGDDCERCGVAWRDHQIIERPDDAD